MSEHLLAYYEGMGGGGERRVRECPPSLLFHCRRAGKSSWAATVGVHLPTFCAVNTDEREWRERRKRGESVKGENTV